MRRPGPELIQAKTSLSLAACDLATGSALVTAAWVAGVSCFGGLGCSLWQWRWYGALKKGRATERFPLPKHIAPISSLPTPIQWKDQPLYPPHKMSTLNKKRAHGDAGGR